MQTSRGKNPKHSKRHQNRLKNIPDVTPVKWIVQLICCGRDDGKFIADTYEEAEAFRESYTSGPAVHPNGFSAKEHEVGHKRAGIISKLTAPTTTNQKEGK